jgi:hypothetical protein
MGGYAAHLRRPGKWFEHPPKAARVKRKKDKVKKIYSIAKAGWHEYQLE